MRGSYYIDFAAQFLASISISAIIAAMPQEGGRSASREPFASRPGRSLA